MNQNPVETIRKKRDGEELSPEELSAFITKASKREIPDYQVSAFLMATYFKGMTQTETVALTQAMIASGTRVEFDDAKPKIDKHSTGGIGDKISLILAPLVASLDVDVPMVAGRGLGHTGGTLDKLESIPGFRVQLNLNDFRQIVLQVGTAIMGQTEDFVPADKLLYSLRDVTATVECIPLITASILSKKAAEGITGLILDIKCGSGAFMKSQKDAERLAKSLVTVGGKLGLKVRAILTDMSQPLGAAVGNAVEVLESIDVLKGGGPQDVRDLTIELAAHMLNLAEKSSSLSAARIMARKALQDGSALQRFRRMIQAQGATQDVAEHPEALRVSQNTLVVRARKAGFVGKIDGEALGMILVDLGGGRHRASDLVDHAVGIYVNAKIGTKLKEGQPLATVHFNPERIQSLGISEGELEKRVLKTFTAQPKKPAAVKLILKVIE